MAPTRSSTGNGVAPSTARSSTTAPSSEPTAPRTHLHRESNNSAKNSNATGSALAGTTIHSKVALLNSYDSRWAIDFQRHNANFDYAQLMADWYAAIQPLATSVDVISPDAPLDQYNMVFAPALNVLPDTTAAHLRDYVQHGGTLVLGPRSGMKDIDNALRSSANPAHSSASSAAASSSSTPSTNPSPSPATQAQAKPPSGPKP